MARGASAAASRDAPAGRRDRIHPSRIATHVWWNLGKLVGSFQRRLLAIAALTVVVFVAAIVAILGLARAQADERRAHAKDNVSREVDALRASLADIPPAARVTAPRQSGELRSGYVEHPSVGGDRPLVDEALARAAASGRAVRIDGIQEGAPIFAAAAPVSGAGYAYASQRVIAGRETRGLRIVVVLLIVLCGSLVVASLRTLRAVQRGVSSLRASLASLAKDLRAPVDRPRLRELGEVADGVSALADGLARAQEERERLTRELGDRERLAALGRVAAGIAHEVRNPLAAMKLRADLARTTGDASPAVARDLEDIASEISRLDRLVSDLLVLAGRRAGPRAAVELRDLVGKRVALLEPWATEKGVTVACEGRGSAVVDGDAIARAVDNLLRNAVEASPRGARVEARIVAGDGEIARVEVADRGPGVPPDRAGELFEPFFTTKPEGTGLGLALARAVATAHGGSLTYARDGDVTRFTMTLG
jgi:signal transduction histidine kinase